MASDTPLEEDFLHIAGMLARPVFVARYNFPFLVFGKPDNEEVAEFDTRVLQALPASGIAERRTPFTTHKLAIISDQPPVLAYGAFAVRKSARNPFSDRISVGRSRACDIVLPSHDVSKLHAHFLRAGDGSIELRDADSSNGTFINDTLLPKNTQAPIRPGDRLRFATLNTELLDAGGLHDWLRRR